MRIRDPHCLPPHMSWSHIGRNVVPSAIDVANSPLLPRSDEVDDHVRLFRLRPLSAHVVSHRAHDSIGWLACTSIDITLQAMLV